MQVWNYNLAHKVQTYVWHIRRAIPTGIGKVDFCSYQQRNVQYVGWTENRIEPRLEGKSGTYRGGM